MRYTIQYTTDFTDAAFQNAFRTYFEELGCRVTNWAGLFAAMGDVGRDYAWTHRDDTGRMVRFVSGADADERNHAFILLAEHGGIVGFIQFTAMHMDSWFFTARCGFIREFWIRNDLRGQGYGTKLLHQAEDWLQQQGCMYILLTTDTAPGFYEKHGYRHEMAIEARNKDKVFVKRL